MDWNNPQHPLARKEPRRGRWACAVPCRSPQHAPALAPAHAAPLPAVHRRAVLRTTVATPQGPLVCYCAHLEVFCGMLARIEQLADIFVDARAMADQASSSGRGGHRLLPGRGGVRACMHALAA